MHRFFLPAISFQGEQVTFPADTARQIQRVLRLHPGDQVVALDNQGWEYTVALSEGQPGGRILSRQVSSGEPLLRLHMFLCLAQREKFEWMLQKCTEVGAGEFTPVISSRSLVQDMRSLENKEERWKRIIQEAAEQSGRGKIPVLNTPLDYESALKSASAVHNLSLLAWEGENSLRIADALGSQERNASVALLIGPEGGLSGEEAALAQTSGWKTVSLGPRILRMETAALVAAALTVAWFEAQPL